LHCYIVAHNVAHAAEPIAWRHAAARLVSDFDRGLHPGVIFGKRETVVNAAAAGREGCVSH
jgi:hypothetical protein